MKEFVRLSGKLLFTKLKGMIKNQDIKDSFFNILDNINVFYFLFFVVISLNNVATATVFLLPIKSLASIWDYLVWSRSFWLYLTLEVFITLSLFVATFFTKREKSITCYKYSITSFNQIMCHWKSRRACHFYMLHIN